MNRLRADNQVLGAIGDARRLTLTMLAITASMLVVAPQEARANPAVPGLRMPALAADHSPIKVHTGGRRNQNAPSVNSPVVMRGVQHVSNVSQNSNISNGFCKKKSHICKVLQNLWIASWN